MRLLLVDPNVSMSSPSMKGVLRSLPKIKEAGFEVEVWCWHCDEGLPVDRVVKLPGIGRWPLVEGYAFSWWAELQAWWAFQVRREERPDVVYSIAWYLRDCDVTHVHFSAFDWGRRQRMIGIRTLRDGIECAANQVLLVWTRWALRATRARLVLCVSRAIAQDMREERSDLAFQVLPNAYDAARFHPGVAGKWRGEMRAQLGFEAEHRVFVFASAGHYRRKGFPLAVDAMVELRRTHPQARLLVIGGLEKRLKRLQRELDRRHPDWRQWVVFTGMVGEVEKYFAAADALLFPSYSEAFALVEVEAAACGLPLFLTRHHGSEMILEDGRNGRYVDFDSRKIAAVLEEFVSGSWTPQGGLPADVLDSSAYAEKLVQVLLGVGGRAGNWGTICGS